MVMDFLDISAKDLKKAHKVLKALDILGISQQQLLNLFKDVKFLKDENEQLKQRLAECEEFIHLQKEADTRQIVQVSKDGNKMVGKDIKVDFTKVEEFYPYGK